MLTDFALDLRLARRKSGLSQHDVAYLAAMDQSTLSDLERGETQPTVRQITQLSMVYGRSFHSLFEEMAVSIKPEMLRRLDALPQTKRSHVTSFVRSGTLKRMRARLTTDAHGGV